VKTIQLWAVERDRDKPSASPVERVDNTETEKSLEDLLVTSPELLMPDLTLIGRQVPTEGGPLDFLDRPKMVLVGLGVDDRARRIVNFLADSRVDIQLLTFNAFRSDDTLLLARQIESRPPKPPITSSPTKASNLKVLLETATDLGVKDLLIAVDEFIEKRIQGYSWPNKMGHSYYLPERTDAGGFTSRCYVSIRLDKKERGSLFLGVWARAATAAGTVAEEFFSSRDFIKDKHGITYLRFRADDWPSLQESLSGFLAAVVEGWKGLSDEAEKDQE
jgi:hypothetical protein